MRVILRRIRSFFALQAVLLVAIVVAGLIGPSHTQHSPHFYAILAADAVFAVVFALAWITTRKPSPYRNLWAIAASLISLATGAYLLWKQHSTLEYATPGLLVLAIGAGGLYCFAQGGAAPKSQSATPPQPAAAPIKPTRVAGDRTSPWVNRLVTAITLIAELAVIYYWSFWAHSHGLTHRGTIPWIVLFTAAVFFSTILHECGHAFFAWGCYMKLLSFHAGPLQWQKHEGKWKFKFHPAGFVDLGGSVRVVPTNPAQPRVHEVWMIAAGPLANIFFGFLLLWAVLDAGWPFYEQAWRLVAFTASFCFIAAATNLLPFMTEDGGYSDGARILQILTKSPLDDFHRTMNSLAATLVTPQRYRDLDVAAIERAAARFPTEIRGLNLQLCALNCYLDTDRLLEARTALAAAEYIYTTYAIDLPARLHTPFVTAHATLNRNAAATRLWWDRMEAKKTEPRKVDYWLAQTALHWIEGRPHDAEEAWQKADAAAQKLPQTGSGDWDRDRCALLRQQILTPLQQPELQKQPFQKPLPALVAPVALTTPIAAQVVKVLAVPTPVVQPAASAPKVQPASRVRVAATRPATPPPADAADAADKPRFDPLQFLRPSDAS